MLCCKSGCPNPPVAVKVAIKYKGQEHAISICKPHLKTAIRIPKKDRPRFMGVA